MVGPRGWNPGMESVDGAHDLLEHMAGWIIWIMRMAGAHG